MNQLSISTVFLDRKGKVIREETYNRSYYDTLPSVGLRMIEIPKSTFWMGSLPTEGYFTEDCPQHEVSIQSFFMSQTPITEAQWRFVAVLPKEQLELDSSYSFPSAFSNHPVTRVSWFEALEFCARLSRHTGKKYRLPTESEWEYACRGINVGIITQSEWNEKYNVPFHFGDTISKKYANYDTSDKYAEESRGKWSMTLTDVHKYKPNAFGLYGMHGNVWEWCLDIWHESYIGAPDNGKVWHEEKEHLYEDILGNLAVLSGDKFTDRVLRGGSWAAPPWECSSEFRYYACALQRDVSIGFRVVSN